jgi:hypothetical protein
MKALAFLTLLILKVNCVFAAGGDSTSIVKNQPDSITKKIVHLLVQATEVSADKPLTALTNYRKALSINKVKDALWEANIRLEMGRILAELKSLKAMTELQQAEALYRKKGNAAGRALAFYEIAKLQEASGQFATALKTYNEVYRIQYKIGEQVFAGNVAAHLTDVFTKKQNYTEAFKYADMAKNAYYSVCRMDSLGSIYFKIASLKRKLKSPKLAEYYILNHALPYYRSSDNLQGRLKSFDFLGSLYLDQKRYSEAKWFYIQANTQSRINADTAGTISSLINLGITKVLIGDLALAKQDISEASEMIKSDSSYAPILKRARLMYPSHFKKLDALATASKNKTKKKAADRKNENLSYIPAELVVNEVESDPISAKNQGAGKVTTLKAKAGDKEKSPPLVKEQKSPKLIASAATVTETKAKPKQTTPTKGVNGPKAQKPAITNTSTQPAVAAKEKAAAKSTSAEASKTAEKAIKATGAKSENAKKPASITLGTTTTKSKKDTNNATPSTKVAQSKKDLEKPTASVAVSKAKKDTIATALK